MEEYFEQIRRKLAGLRSSLRWMFVAHGMARVLLALALLLLWHYGTDVLLHLSLPLRAGALLIMAGVVGFILVRKIAYPLSRRISEEELALLVENEYPLLNDRLITALQLYRDRDRYRDVASQAMVDSVILEGFEVANRLRFRDVVQSGRLLMMTGVAVAAVLMLGVVLFADQAQAQRWARRLLLENVEYERDVKLDIQFPSDLERFPTSDALILNHTYDMDARKVRVARGAGLRIVAIPKSGDSESATIRFEPEEGEAHEEKMNVEYEESGEERKVAYYHYNIPAVLGDQDIFIEAGDANDGPFFVEAAHAPALAKDTRIIYNYPSYMGREEEIQTGTRNIAAPEKTKVRIEFQTERNEALAEHGAFVTFYVTGADPQKVEATPLDATHSRFSVEYQLDASTTEYEFTLLGNDGLRNTERLRYTIRAEIDRPPEVSFTFHGKGLEDESRVPVTPGGILPLRFTVKDRYGVKKRDLLYRAFLPDSTEKDPEWKPLAAFSAAYERRDGALTTIAQNINTILSTLRDAHGVVSRNEELDASAFILKLRGAASTINGQLLVAQQIAREELRAATPELMRAFNDFAAAWSNLGNAAASATPQALKRDKDDVLSGLETITKYATSALDAAHGCLRISRTDTHEEYTLKIADLLEGTDLAAEAKLHEAMVLNGSQPVGMEIRVEAEDSNFHKESGRGGVGESITISLDLMTRSALEGRISRYIRTSLKEDLNRTYQKLEALHKDMKSFVELQRTLTFSNDEEGRASRDILSRAQTRQAELPDATLKLAERFSNVAQAYAFNDVEADDIEKKQENTIQVVRIILMLLSADTDLGNTIANNMSAARTHAEELARQAAINSLLAELGLLDGLTGVRSSFDRNAFAGILASSTYRDPATLSRLDLLYKSIMRPEATSDTRRRDLEAVIEAQSQTLAGFKIVLDRVGRWETFAAIREEAQRVADMLDQAIKEMKESQKGR